MIKILLAEARKNRKIIFFYLTACIIVSAFYTPLMSQTLDVFASDLLSETETVDSLIGLFTGKTILKLSGSYSQIVGISAEPFTALLVIGVIENLNRFVGMPMEIASTPAGNPIVLLLVFIFFVIGKIMRSNEATEVFGMITLGEIEKYLGLGFVLLLGVLNVAGISTFAVNTVEATSEISNTTPGFTYLSQAATVTTSIILGIISIVVFYIVKTAFWGIEVLQVSLSFIPGSALVFELLKSLLVFFLVTVNVIFPKIGMVLNIIIFIICCIVFKRCFVAMLYFRSIYLYPTIKMINGYSPYKELISQKLPSKIRKNFVGEEGMENLDLAVPIYPLKKTEELQKLKRHEKWWLISCNKTLYICRKKAFHKAIIKIPLESTTKDSFYINKNIRFFEIFDLMPNQSNKKRKKRHLAFALSKEYWYRFKDIKEITGFIDYEDLKAEEKQSSKAIKEEKKLMKQEARLKKRLEKENVKK